MDIDGIRSDLEDLCDRLYLYYDVHLLHHRDRLYGTISSDDCFTSHATENDGRHEEKSEMVFPVNASVVFVQHSSDHLLAFSTPA